MYVSINCIHTTMPFTHNDVTKQLQSGMINLSHKTIMFAGQY